MSQWKRGNDLLGRDGSCASADEVGEHDRLEGDSVVVGDLHLTRAVSKS